MGRIGCVYLLASARHGTLYLGVTSDLRRRIWQHREEITGGFTAEHDVKRLVWFETHASIEAAILREKRIKKWRRDWKVELIEAGNPQWDDLAVGLFGFAPLAAKPVRPFRTIA